MKTEAPACNPLLFRNATLVDGSGAPLRRADVAVVGDRIAAVGPELDCSSGQIIDADGLVLAPGFIDIHGHSDMTLFRHPLMKSKAFQGVTSEVIGNCGLGLFPLRLGGEAELAAYLRLHDYSLPEGGITWHDLAGYAERVDSEGLGINVAPLVGHAPLRNAVMGMNDRAPSLDEQTRMELLLDTALRQGAWGMSSGLIYPPGSYAATDELLSLARVLARHNALYTSHIRSESDGIDAALDEALTIVRGSGARLQVSHLKAMGGSNRGRAREFLARLAAARGEGIDVGADQYPYSASATTPDGRGAAAGPCRRGRRPTGAVGRFGATSGIGGRDRPGNGAARRGRGDRGDRLHAQPAAVRTERGRHCRTLGLPARDGGSSA